MQPATAESLPRPLAHLLVQALNWVFGTSSTVKNSLINLSDGHSQRICYIAAHTGVIYDKRTQKQSFLQVRPSTALLHEQYGNV